MRGDPMGAQLRAVKVEARKRRRLSTGKLLRAFRLDCEKAGALRSQLGERAYAQFLDIRRRAVFDELVRRFGPARTMKKAHLITAVLERVQNEPRQAELFAAFRAE